MVQKWEYIILNFNMRKGEALILMPKGKLEKHNLSEKIKNFAGLPEFYNLVKIDFLSTLGSLGWEVIEVLDSNQILLKRKLPN